MMCRFSRRLEARSLVNVPILRKKSWWRCFAATKHFSIRERFVITQSSFLLSYMSASDGFFNVSLYKSNNVRFQSTNVNVMTPEASSWIKTPSLSLGENAFQISLCTPLAFCSLELLWVLPELFDFEVIG